MFFCSSIEESSTCISLTKSTRVLEKKKNSTLVLNTKEICVNQAFTNSYIDTSAHERGRHSTNKTAIMWIASSSKNRNKHGGPNKLEICQIRLNSCCISNLDDIIHVRSPAGAKISWYFHRSYGLMAGDADPPFFVVVFFFNRFFVISGTFGSFWDLADHYNYMRFYWMDD